MALESLMGCAVVQFWCTHNDGFCLVLSQVVHNGMYRKLFLGIVNFAAGGTAISRKTPSIAKLYNAVLKSAIKSAPTKKESDCAG